MGLFINENEHPGLFRQTTLPTQPNQIEYRRDAMADFMEEQIASNKNIHRAIDILNNSQNKITQQQIRRWKEIEERLIELKFLTSRHEKLEHDVIDWLEKLENQNFELHGLIKSEQQDKQILLNKVQSVDTSHENLVKQFQQFELSKDEIVKRLDQFDDMKNEVILRLEQLGTVNEEMLQKMDQQHELHHHMAEQMTVIEETQQEVLNRVDHQEGFMEKMIHQIDHVRFILFERTNSLEEKIEKVYQQTISFIQKFKSDSNKQPTFVPHKEKDE